MIMERDTTDIEYREKVTDTFLKTVSAFSNGTGGKSIFGITDRRETVGLSNPEKSALQIENKINDSIQPQPQYRISIDTEHHTVTLKVEEGPYKPYYWGNKAYIRRDSSSVEMDIMDLESLILQKKNLDFDALPSSRQNLTFLTLNQELKQKLDLDNPGSDTCKSLGLLKPGYGYTIAAELLSDENSFPGIELVRYGADENEIQNRATVEGCSLLTGYKEAEKFFNLYFRSELIRGSAREEYYRIPKNAFREAVLNSLIHRDWKRRNSRILIRMYDDCIKISSPGGLPEGITQEEYLEDDLSVSRNPDHAYVFLRLGYIERLGSGIRRILSSYRNQTAKPAFSFSTNVITVTLPVLDAKLNVCEGQTTVLNYIRENLSVSRKDIEQHTGFGRSKTARLLKELTALNLIEKSGNGPSTRYRLYSRPASILGTDKSIVRGR